LDFEPGSAIPETEQLDFKPRSAIPKTEQLDFGPGSAIPITEQLDFGPKNDIPITEQSVLSNLKVEFKYSTITSTIQLFNYSIIK
jgi:hypothetical protein